MKPRIKSLLFAFFCLMLSLKASAQSELLNITGTLSQNKNAEIALWSKTPGAVRMVATAILEPGTHQFAFAIPYLAEAKYQLKVTILKMGHLRLEKDIVVDFPLQLSPKQNLHLRLNPAEFAAKTTKGLLIEKQALKFSTATVTGTLTNWKLGGELSLAKVEEGSLKKIASFNVDKSAPSFSFLIPVEAAGFYYLSTPRWNKRLYLKPNEQIALNIDGALGVQTEWTKATAENKVLSDWAQLILPATAYGYQLELRHKAILDAEAFRNHYQEIQPKIKAFLQQVNTGNERFNVQFKTAAKMDNSLLALRSILNLAGKRHLFWLPAKEFSNVTEQYIQILNQNKVSSTDLLGFGEGNEYINLWAKFSLNGFDEAKRQQLGDEGKLQTMMAATPNETLKSFLLKSQLEELSVANYSEFKRVFEPYAKYAKPASVKWKYNHVLEQFAPDTAFIGKSAYDFILPDVNGKNVSMKDFKGKVVLIDVWATWCGPCKAQMPFLKEIEESYKGNDNIVFVGISVDSESVKQKWLDMIKEKDLDGVQLLDNSGKSFAKKYKIAAIPRFLLIDKKGNWVEVRCPLPEDQLKLKSYIDRELKKGV